MSSVTESGLEFLSDGELISTLDLHNPWFQRRSLVLRMRGVKEQELRLNLQMLVPDSVYLVEDDGYGLKRGQVLVRNLDLMRRLGRTDDPYDKQMFVRYDNLYDAYRAMSRLNPTYKAEEIPAMEALQRGSNELMELTWSLDVNNTSKHHEYEVRAWEAVRPHKNVNNEHKVAARDQMIRATNLKDRRGRFNPHRLPLMLLSVDIAAWKRIREARGIGHRMDFRAMVLDLYIHKLSEMVEITRLDLKQLLRPNGVFHVGPNRRPSKIREAADRVRATEKHLRTLVARPFEHVFQNVAKDLEEAANLMDEASVTHDPLRMDEAKLYIHRSYRSLALVQQGWLLQELLATVATIHHRKQVWLNNSLGGRQILESIIATISLNESFTNEPFEQGFRRPILDRVTKHLKEAIIQMSHLAHDPFAKKELAELHKQLKLAVAPF